LQRPGIQLPVALTVFGTYVEAMQTDSLLSLSGMRLVVNHTPRYLGSLRKELDTEVGRDALHSVDPYAIAAAAFHLSLSNCLTH